MQKYVPLQMTLLSVLLAAFHTSVVIIFAGAEPLMEVYKVDRVAPLPIQGQINGTRKVF